MRTGDVILAANFYARISSMRTRFKQSFYFIINNCDTPHPELRNSQLEPVLLNLFRKMCISIDEKRQRYICFNSCSAVCIHVFIDGRDGFYSTLICKITKICKCFFFTSKENLGKWISLLEQAIISQNWVEE